MNIILTLKRSIYIHFKRVNKSYKSYLVARINVLSLLCLSYQTASVSPRPPNLPTIFLTV